MLCQVAREQHAGLHTLLLDIAHQRIAVHAFPAGDQETEPAGIGIRAGLRKDQAVLRSLQRRLQKSKVLFPALHEGGEFLQLGAADGSLHVRGLQVVAEVGIDVLVVVALRQLPVLSVKTVAAEIVHAGGAHAVPAPVPHGADDAVQQRIPRVDRAAFSHGHVMGRIEAGGADIAHGACQIGPGGTGSPAVHSGCSGVLSCRGAGNILAQRVGAAQGVAVVLHQPETVLHAEGLHCREVKGVPQRMGDHHRLRLFRERLLQAVHIDIVLRDRHVHEYRYRAVLDHGRHGGGESRRHSDHLVSRPDLPFLKERRSERHKGAQVRAGA